MQSHTLIESQPKSTNDPFNSTSVTNGHPTRMGPVPEFLRPLPVLSSSNSNTTLKYKKAAILNHNLTQGIDAKYNNVHSYNKYERSKYESSENNNGYGGNKDLATSGDSENENNHFLNSKPGSNGYPKHFASMQGPYGIINNSMFLKKEEVKSDRFLSSDLLNNNASDKVNSSHVNYSGQFQANFIGHIAHQNYLNRPVHVPSSQGGEQALYLNNASVNRHSDRLNDNREISNKSNPDSRNSPQNRATPPKPEQSNQENTSLDDQQGNANKKFKVPTSKVPKESLLKYRILHKNNQRNVTHINAHTEPASPATLQQQEPTLASTVTNGARSSSRNGSPCDSNFSSSSHFSNAEAVSNNAQFKRPVDSEPQPVSQQGGESTSGVINSEIQPNHFSKGVLIKLENGLIKHLEDLKTEDFVSSAEKSTRHRLEPSTVMKVEEKPGGSSIVLTLCYGEKRHQVEYESMIEQPYYVINKGWCSFNPSRTHNKYGLVCKQLNVGDTCISLCQKNTTTSTTTGPPSPNKPTTSQTKANKRKELEKHFNLLSSKDREMNERKKRRWSAPDQINEKTSKKLSAKQIKLNEDNQDGDNATSTNVPHVATLPTSTNQFQTGEQNLIVSSSSSYQQSHQEAFPNSSNSYYNQYATSSNSNGNTHPAFPSMIQSSHLQYVSNASSHPSSSSSTSLTHLITTPIVSHVPMSSSVLAVSSGPSSNFSISTLSTPASSHPAMYSSGKPSYLIHSSPSLPGMPSSVSSPSSNINFQSSSTTYASISSTPSFINGAPISSNVFVRNGSYPMASPMKYSAAAAKNNFSNVGTLAKSANGLESSNIAVDFSKYSSKK